METAWERPFCLGRELGGPTTRHATDRYDAVPAKWDTGAAPFGDALLGQFANPGLLLFRMVGARGHCRRAPLRINGIQS